MFINVIFIGACFWFVCCRSQNCSEGFCYYLGPRVNYTYAEPYCNDTGGVLTSILSYEETQYLADTFLPACKQGAIEWYVGCWTGLNDLSIEGTFEWIDGSLFNYTYWYTNQPNNANGDEHCVQIVDGGYWNDARCEFERSPICKTIQTMNPTVLPTDYPTTNPTISPSLTPTENPTPLPTLNPTHSPSEAPTQNPSLSPSTTPTLSPSEAPTEEYTQSPSTSPTPSPSTTPTIIPSSAPTMQPTELPTARPSVESTVDSRDDVFGIALVYIYMIIGVILLYCCCFIFLIMKRKRKRPVYDMTQSVTVGEI